MKLPWLVRLVPAFAYRAWFTPPPGRPGPVLGSDLEPISVLGPESEVTGFAIGQGPLALAVHGWGGRSLQMSAIARRLASDGYRVVAVDLPGGAGSQPTDIKRIAAALEAVVESLGDPAVVVAHSFGNQVSRLALADRPQPIAVVLVAPLMQVSDALRVFSERLQLAPWVRWSLPRRLSRWDPSLWAWLDSAQPDLYPGADLLVVHDPSDLDTPYRSSRAVALSRPSTELVTVTGLGHSLPLTDEAVLDTVSRFVSARVPAG